MLVIAHVALHQNSNMLKVNVIHKTSHMMHWSKVFHLFVALRECKQVAQESVLCLSSHTYVHTHKSFQPHKQTHIISEQWKNRRTI